MTSPAVVDGTLSRALAFLGELRLPGGASLAESWVSDPWIVSEIVEPALRCDDRGIPANRYMWDERPKGGAKTTTYAALLLYGAVTQAQRQAYILCKDAEQGVQGALDVLRSFCDQYPKLNRLVRWRGDGLYFPNGSFIKVLSHDPAGFHGLLATGRSSRFLLDEFTQWGAADLWHAVVSTMGKMPDSACWIACNAGISGSFQESVRQDLRDAGAHVTCAPEGWLPSWMSWEALETEKALLPGPIWDRFYRGKWISEGSSFTSLDAWDACKVAELRPPSEKAYHFVGVDGAVTQDHFAIVSVTRDWGHPVDGVAIQDLAVWVPAPGRPVDLSEPEEWLRQYALAHERVCVVYDRHKIEYMMQGLEREMWCLEFSQQDLRAVADTQLYTQIMRGKVKHRGEPEIREHLNNAVLRVSPGATAKGRIDKKSDSRHVDLLVALSMSSYQCLAYLADP